MPSKKIAEITADLTPDLADIMYASDSAGTVDKQFSLRTLNRAGSGTYAEADNRKLWNHRRALSAAAAGTSREVLAYLGDSITEGYTIASIDDRPLNVCQSILRDRHTSADTGRGYIPVSHGAFVSHTEDPVLSGSTILRNTEGFGFRSVALSASGAKATWTLVGTDMILCYASFVSAGKSEYRITPAATGIPGAYVEVDHNGGSGLNFREEQTAVHLGALDTYTVEWRWKSTGAGAAPDPIIEGIIEVNGDPTKGISVLDMGRSGATASTFKDHSHAYLIQQWISDHDVTAVVLGLGVNEWQAGTPAADYKEDLLALIELLRDGNADLEVVLHGGWIPFGTGDPDDWHLYVDVQYEIAQADPLTSVYDMRRFMPDPGVVTTADHYDALGVHPNATGGQAIGAADADLLSLRSGGGYAQQLYATEAYADAKVTDAITNGVTDIAPSQNAVYDALALKATLASPALTGNPTAPTATAGDNDTSIATTAFVTAADSVMAGAGYVTGDRTGPPWITLTTRAVAQGNLFLVPYYVRSAVTFDRLYAEVSTAGTGSTVLRFGIWNHNTSTGKPGTLIVDGGTASGTGLAEVSVTISQALTQGIVWLGVAAQTVTGSPVVRGFQNGLGGRCADVLPPQGTISSGLVPVCCLLVTGQTGAFGTMVGASFSSASSSGPIIQARVG